MEAQEHNEKEAYISVITYWGFGHDPLCFFLHLWRDEVCGQAPIHRVYRLKRSCVFPSKGGRRRNLLKPKAAQSPNLNEGYVYRGGPLIRGAL